MKSKTVVHITHEAVGKIGGIGAVLEGLLTSKSYQNQVNRDILVGPLFSIEGDLSNRLGPNSEVLYSSLDGMSNTDYFDMFRKIEKLYNVNIIYGKKRFYDTLTKVESWPEILLFDITQIEPTSLNTFKRRLFEEFGIRSNQFEHIWEYEQYVRLAIPAIACIKEMVADQHDHSTILVSHEFMGMPTVLAGKLDPTYDFRGVFYAHEVATMRRIVEHHPGHDTMFYNAMKFAYKKNLFVNDVFSDQSTYFKHSLVDAARHCENILAVGDCVVEELNFMAPEFSLADIELTYNGIPSYEVSLAETQQSKQRLQEYCHNLLGYKPNYIFTHVTRMVPSKGLWRDLKVLEHLDKEFITQNMTGILFVLSTEVGHRSKHDVYRMEDSYHWPTAHHDGWPDLSGGESAFYAGVQEFNARCRNIKVVYINQFGFSRECCGNRMPYDMEFMDIRKGSDIEFGQSIYEPFGIAQLEPLTFGGICVVTNICGCSGFVNKITDNQPVKNVIVADYTELDGHPWTDLEDLTKIGKTVREKIEQKVSSIIALEICARLPKNDDEKYSLIRKGYDLARHMGWDQVASNYVLPALNKALDKPSKRKVYLRA